ncbi:hydroxyisourate hydrolase [Halosquirtibacter laminarini]|uniref:Hydroxyisourate hydrolase n=1 Tax=Halosquirtibacter laminarini TaxID=3374600 RepID=A0AC61NR11_9BACT|nr:hydroxyisourate hydrolase [Prolixibacteraceae bacterium]
MKNILPLYILLLLTTLSFAQNKVVVPVSQNESPLIITVKSMEDRSPIHGLRIRLSNLNAIENKWQFVDEQITDKVGKISKWDANNINGIIELKIYTADYFRQRNIESIFPYLIFRIYKEKLKSKHLTLHISPNSCKIQEDQEVKK